jgi:D-xylose 1-dehydrogenase (NADP+, D-xylono-1,5-lactone-forming)
MGLTRWGILSTARINEKVLAGAALSDEAEIVAVGSRDQANADEYAQEHGIPRAHGSYEALLADPEIDAVYISLPNGLHADWAMRSLEAGKHVLVEKPLSRRVADAEAVFGTAEAVDRFCMEAFMWRHNPQTRKLKELLDDGAIGELRLVRAAFSFSLTDLGNVRMRPELDGGSLMDVGCYCVSGVRLLAGEPERVTAQQVVGPTGVDVRFVATLSFGGDVLAQIDSALDLPDRSELEAIGSDGSISVQDPWHSARPALRLRRGDGEELLEIEPENSYKLELENLGRAIRGEGHPLLGREDAVGQARTIEALYRSAETGEAVDLR